MTIDEMIAVLTAAKDGKVIQARPNHSTYHDWAAANEPPDWNFRQMDYRVKPEPREFWIVQRKNTDGWGARAYQCEQLGFDNGDRQIKVREVIETGSNSDWDIPKL